MSRRRRGLLLGLALALPAIAAWLHFVVLRPPLMAETEILPGIRYLSERVERPDGSSFQAVVVKVDLANPRIEVFQPTPNVHRDEGHFRLALPDWLLWKHDLDVLINTTPFHAELTAHGEVAQGHFSAWRGYPGRAVWSYSPIVSNRHFSHIPKSTHLFWVDRQPRAHIAPGMSDKELVALIESNEEQGISYGFGLENVQVLNGRGLARRATQSPDRGLLDYWVFIGTDETGRWVYLIGTVDSTMHEVFAYAERQGVYNGGLLDSGNASWLIVGPRAEGMLPHAGIRAGRPIAAFLGFRSR